MNKTEEELIWNTYNNFHEYNNLRKFLLENPVRTDGDYQPIEFEGDNPKGMYEYIKTPNSKYKKIYDLTINGSTSVSLYERQEFGNTYDIKVISEENKIVVGNIIYDKTNNGIEIDSIYNQGMFRGVIYKVFFEYLLPKYNKITSSAFHSQKGEGFWRKVLEYGFLKHESFSTYVINLNTSEQFNINNLNDIGSYYGDEGEDFEKYRFVIEKK